MKPFTPVVIALVSLLVVSVFFGYRWHGELNQSAVALQVAQVRYTEDSTAFARRVEALEDSLSGLAAVGNSLRGDLAIARQASAAGLVTIRSLLARSRALTPAEQATADTALQAIAQLGPACDALIGNCEDRVAAEHTGRVDALERLRKADSLRTVANQHLVDAERRARPSFWRDLWRARVISVPAIVTATACLVR